MIKHTIEISQDSAHLCVRNSQLVLRRDKKDVTTIPCEDIGIVIVDHPQVTYSHAALAELAANDAAVVICGPNHLPTAMLLPLADHSQVVWRLRDQINASRPLTKRLWKQIVEAKIFAQASNIDNRLPARKLLMNLMRSVRSGDPENIEAQAAKIYWANWLGHHGESASGTGASFKRDHDADGLNSFLNYGYAIVRAGMARAIVNAGLMPSLGIHHCNRRNAYCLADDLMEPIRPVVDRVARELHQDGATELNQTVKASLLKVLTTRTKFRSQTGPLMVNLNRYAASLAKCFAGEQKFLDIPEFAFETESSNQCLSTDTGACGS